MSADLLRQAADLIEQRAADATLDRYEAVENYPGCWQVHAVGPELRPPPHKGINNPQRERFNVAEDSQEGDIREGDAHWIAMLGPQVAVPLVAWLRFEAGHFDRLGRRVRVVDFARAVLDEKQASDG